MMQRRPFRTAAVLLFLTAPALAGCSDGWRTSLGLKQTAPDEFKVAERAPLTMPPSLNELPPPRPGAGRPQATSPRTRARQALFASPAGQATAAGARSGGLSGGSNAASGGGALSDGERRLLTRANAGAAPDDIRDIVARESEARAQALRGPLDDYIFWQDSPRPGEAVDAAAEARRLRENRAQGRPLNAGEVPVEERKDRGILGGL
jgi:hypothetical protein